MKRKQLYAFESIYVHVTCRGGALAIAHLYGRVHPWTFDTFDPEAPKRDYGFPVEGGRMVIRYDNLTLKHDRELSGCKMYSGVVDPTWDGQGEFPGDLLGTVYYHEGELCLVRDIDPQGMTNWEYAINEKYGRRLSRQCV